MSCILAPAPKRASACAYQPFPWCRSMHAINFISSNLLAKIIIWHCYPRPAWFSPWSVTVIIIYEWLMELSSGFMIDWTADFHQNHNFFVWNSRTVHFIQRKETNLMPTVHAEHIKVMLLWPIFLSTHWNKHTEQTFLRLHKGASPGSYFIHVPPPPIWKPFKGLWLQSLDS